MLLIDVWSALMKYLKLENSSWHPKDFKIHFLLLHLLSKMPPYLLPQLFHDPPDDVLHDIQKPRIDNSLVSIVAEKHVVSVHEKCGQQWAWVAVATAVGGTPHLGEEEPSGEIVEGRGGLRDCWGGVGCSQGCR